ncbi:hypothetical protein GCM10008015_25730 [Flavobacterium palustre]|uniref:Uncharacterized protein n=1 Tax=Flavobacterium palustre TaxID=1476463 RepID=A0ABQ1HMX2_9FLAO|nr:hypothetical protein [Flavobacterium palustre]GGA83728.1 hypothetical protein GCM10008015_25730 [Flavobacterium palustre]
MPLNVIQITQINQVPFVISNSNEANYPLSPLVSTTLFTPANGKDILKIRVTLYIDSADKELPWVEPNPEVIENSLQLYFDYNYQEEKPVSLNVWYMELDYTSDTLTEITSITSFLKDIDPEVSKGTRTQIQNN